MPLAPIELGEQSNPGRGYRDGSGRLINCYVEPRGKEGRHNLAIYPVDGITSFSELPVQSSEEEEGQLLMETGDQLLSEGGDDFTLEGNPFAAQRADPNKGVQVMIPDNGYLWVITGSGVYKVDQGGYAIFIGPIAGSNVVTADKNRYHQIGIVSDGYYYVLDTLNDTLTDYSTSLFYTAPNSVVHYNGYMVVTFSNGSWQISNLDDATLWDALDLETTQFRSGMLKRAVVRGGELLLLGQDSIEFWQDVGATNGFTMQRASATEVGIGPALSAHNLDETVLFIDDDFAVRQVEGYKTAIISSSFVARKIRQATDPQSIRATSYERDGHMFYSISCDDFTLTYNMATGKWHEEMSYGLKRRRINHVTKFRDTWYAGDYVEGVVYTLSQEIHNENTDPIVMEVITPPVHAFPNRIRVRGLYIDAMFGTALASDVNDDESDPKIMVWISEDDGENFVFLEELSLGDINSKYEELRVQGVGTSDQNGFVFKLSISTPVVRGILGMSADITPVRA